MSPEKQRIAIAEACGYTWFPNPMLPGQKILALSTEHAATNKLGSWVWALAPDYLNDLNAMHDAEMILSKDQHRWFCNHLRFLCDNDGAISSLADVRAIALLRSIGKWEESA
jgi:hypothetical protein